MENASATTTERKRPLCRFFVMGTCKFGSNCSFSHTLPPEGLTKGRKQIPCKWFHQKKSCRFGSRCHFSHDGDSLETTNDDSSITCHEAGSSTNETTSIKIEHEDFNCGICLDNIVQSGKRFGLLSKCNHCFCIDCLRKWRGSSAKGNQPPTVTQSCPSCRTKSNMVIPSKKFVVGVEKEIVLQGYKNKMEAMPCRYFDGSIGSCPFGKSCFYAHLNWDGENLKPNDKRRPPRRKVNGPSPSDDLMEIFQVLMADQAILEEQVLSEEW
mmetsp:Transcript_30392/g.36116  ORF Transcript_30392/g.36116 Transcript_30392/m.36116 type:complete len:268 (+) Transcript_30392:100-903(+)